MSLKVTLTGGGKKIELEERTVTASTDVVTVLPTEGKAMSKVIVNPTPTETKTVTPKASQQTVTPSAGKHLSRVTVNGDADLVAENIAKDIDIFGIKGKLINICDVLSLVSDNPIMTYSYGKTTHVEDEGSLYVKHNLPHKPSVILIGANGVPMTRPSVSAVASLCDKGIVVYTEPTGSGTSVYQKTGNATIKHTTTSAVTISAPSSCYFAGGIAYEYLIF